MVQRYNRKKPNDLNRRWISCHYTIVPYNRPTDYLNNENTCIFNYLFSRTKIFHVKVQRYRYNGTIIKKVNWRPLLYYFALFIVPYFMFCMFVLCCSID